MKTILSILVLFLLNSVSFGQVGTWGKSDRDNVYNDCMSFLGSNYKHLSNDQKETISLCFLDQVTSKFTKETYQAKIEVELKRLRSATIGECAKTHGIELIMPVVSAEPQKAKSDKPNKDNLTGHWKEKHEDREFWLNDGGNFTMMYEGKRSNGTWKIDDDKLTLYFDRMFGTKQMDYEILMFSDDKFVYQSKKNGETYTVSKIK